MNHGKDHPRRPESLWIRTPGQEANKADVDEYNKQAQAAYEASMPRCGCGRTFETLEKLASHSKGCESATCLSSVAEAASQPPGNGPRMLVCYICGTQHGISSLKIHQRQCTVKHERVQEKMLLGERSSIPEVHSTHSNPNPSPNCGSFLQAPCMAIPDREASMSIIEEYNQEAQKVPHFSILLYEIS